MLRFARRVADRRRGVAVSTRGCDRGAAVRSGYTERDLRSGASDGGDREELDRERDFEGVFDGDALLRALDEDAALVRVGDEAAGWGGFDDGECAGVLLGGEGRNPRRYLTPPTTGHFEMNFNHIIDNSSSLFFLSPLSQLSCRNYKVSGFISYYLLIVTGIYTLKLLNLMVKFNNILICMIVKNHIQKKL